MTQEHDAETVERVAKAIWAHNFPDHSVPRCETDMGAMLYGMASAALSAMPAREVTGWEPISTAPHGVEVMVVKAGTHPFTGKPYIPITAYYEPHIWTDHMDRICDDYDPTHWMPLPPAPEGV